MTKPSRRRRAALAFAVGASVPLLLVAAWTAPALANPDPEPVPGPSMDDPGYDPNFPGDPGDAIFVDPGLGPPLSVEPMFDPPLVLPWYIYENVLTGQFSLAQQNPGYGWLLFDGPYDTFALGGADMKALGVPGWEAF